MLGTGLKYFTKEIVHVNSYFDGYRLLHLSILLKHEV